MARPGSIACTEVGGRQPRRYAAAVADASVNAFNRMMADAVLRVGAFPHGDWQVRLLRLHDVIGSPRLDRVPHVHAWFELSVVTAGTVAYQSGGDMRLVGPGGAFAMPPGHLHGWRIPHGRATITGFQLIMVPTADATHQALDAWSRRIAGGGWTLPAHPLAVTLCDELHAAAGRGGGGAEVLARCLAGWLLGRLGEPVAIDGPGVADPMDRFRAFVTRHLTEDLPAQRLADHLGMTTRHLGRLCVQAHGMPVQRYIMTQRLERATHALVWSDTPVSEIARSVGFADPDHFTRRFRDRYGMPPERWRRREATIQG